MGQSKGDRNMKQGDRVNIYHDPLTERELEGKAQLLKRVTENVGSWEGRTISLWEVKFADGAKVWRKVLEPEVENDGLPTPLPSPDLGA